MTYKSKKDLCNTFGINYDTVYHRCKSFHETFEVAFIKLLRKGFEEHKLDIDLGLYRELSAYFQHENNISEDYVSIDYLCRLWGIDRKTFNYRKSLGWDLRHILEG